MLVRDFIYLTPRAGTNFIKSTVIEATTASFLAALKKGQLDKVMANPTSFVRKYGEIDRRMAEINLPLSREDEIDQAQSLFMIACTDVGRQLTLVSNLSSKTIFDLLTVLSENWHNALHVRTSRH